MLLPLCPATSACLNDTARIANEFLELASRPDHDSLAGTALLGLNRMLRTNSLPEDNSVRHEVETIVTEHLNNPEADERMRIVAMQVAKSIGMDGEFTVIHNALGDSASTAAIRLAAAGAAVEPFKN